MILYGLTNIEKIYDERKVLDIRHLEIEQGCIYALLGPNGAGKTTLLNILAFLDPPTCGEVRFKSNLVRFAESALFHLRRKVIMVDQNPILFTTTVFKNLEFGLKIRKVPKKIRLRLVEETLDLVGMSDFMFAKANRLSGGETRRVALARALILSPEVFLCDEPMSGVDIENQVIINRVLRKINKKKGATIIFTSHDRLQASSIADHTMTLNYGSLVAGRFENLFSADITRKTDRESLCAIYPDILLSMASNGVDNSGKNIRIAIDPDKIRIVLKHSEKKTENVLHGKVIQALEEESRVRVVIDAKVLLTLIMNMRTYRQKGLLVGDDVNVYIPPEAVQRI